MFTGTLVAGQRLHWALRGALAPGWELLSRWETGTHSAPDIGARSSAQGPNGCCLYAWGETLGGVLLAFYGMARVGEVLKCCRRQLVLPEDLFSIYRVDDPVASRLISLACADLGRDELLFPMSPVAFRSRWDRCLDAYGIPKTANLMPGGLRGGGAVAAYHGGLSVAHIQWRMRLKHMHTLEYYLQEVAALTAMNGLAADSKLRVN